MVQVVPTRYGRQENRRASPKNSTVWATLVVAHRRAGTRPAPTYSGKSRQTHKSSDVMSNSQCLHQSILMMWSNQSAH